MSVTDDASTVSLSAPLPRRGLLARIAAGFLLGAFALITGGPRALPDSVARFRAEAPWFGDTPDASEWPRPPGPGESAAVEDRGSGRVIVVSAPDPAQASMMASSMAWERTSGAGEDRARRQGLLAAIERDQFTGPLYRIAPAAECAALLRAHARVARALAGPSVVGEGTPPDAAERVTSLAIEEAARNQDAAMVSDALAASLIVESERLARDAAVDRPSERDLRAPWEARLHRYASEWDRLTGPLETDLTPLQTELIALVTPSLAREAEPRFTVPSSARLGASPPPPAPRVRPIAALTLGFGAAGGVLGAVLGVVVGFALRRGPQRARRRARRVLGDSSALRTSESLELLEAEKHDPSVPGAWLQIVSGPRPRDVARGVIEIVAHGAAAGGRVLVVDAGRSLALHRAFEAEGRPGLVDCLSRPLPALGVVQQGGAARVLLLAYGDPRRRPVWVHLDRLLEEVRPHCDRLVLALAHDAPGEIGSVLAGRLMDGWWTSTARATGAVYLSDRLGIAFHPLNLEPRDQPSLELLRRRIAFLIPGHSSPGAETHPAAAHPTGALVAAPPAAHQVLDSDPHVRDRLRFLTWMRRVRAEGRGEAITSSKD